MAHELAVLIPVYNNPEGLVSTLRSLARAESDLRFTVVVVDDGSTPPAGVDEAIALELKIIRLTTNGGITKALNVGLEWILEQGYPFVARLDAGDLCEPERFTKQLRFLREHPHHALVGSGARICDTQGALLYLQSPPSGETAMRRALHVCNVLLHSSLMFRSEAIRETGPYSEAYDAAEDYELILRLASRYGIGAVDEPLVSYEMSPNGISARKRREQIKSRIRLQLAYFAPWLPQSYYGLARSVLTFLLPWPAIAFVLGCVGRLKSAAART